MPPDRSPILNRDALLAYLLDGAKPPADWGVGVEFEQIGLTAADLSPLPYAGPGSVEAVLSGLQARFGWEPVHEAGRLIALARDGAAVTLEPGGQVELSGRVHRDPADVRTEIDQFQAELRTVSDPIGIHWLAIGLHPFAHLEEIPWMPKARYRILADHLSRTGEMAHHMMKKTAGVQVNLDFRDEADAVEKFRVAMGLTSISTALFANSPITEGETNRLVSARAHIWLHTDPARCGLLRFAFDPDLSLDRYVEYALGVPSLFLLRDGRWVGTGGVTFRDLLDRGWEGEPVRREDWALHLTGLFPEVRLKQYLEVRGADTTDAPGAAALAAFWFGLLYDDESRAAAWDQVAELAWDERLALHRAVCRDGLRATVRGRPVGEVAQSLIGFARDGLARCGIDPDPLRRLDTITADGGGEPARAVLEIWDREAPADRAARLVELRTHGRPIASGTGGDDL